MCYIISTFYTTHSVIQYINKSYNEINKTFLQVGDKYRQGCFDLVKTFDVIPTPSLRRRKSEKPAYILRSQTFHIALS